MERYNKVLKDECIQYFSSNPYSVETILSVSRRIGRDKDILGRTLESLSKEMFINKVELNGEYYYSLSTTPIPSKKNEYPESYLNDFKLLTSREKEVFYQLVDGHSNGQIAQNLIISPDTVKNHISNIYRKLKVNDRVSLIKMYFVNIE
ncbi:response regulator transcription factor [Cytobacillus luteolus]|nr:LuxR C-terminal-related transcriptional regulator [Cytobacillus luteolus]MBP1943600.1 DNA-binding NarL/FixJ family response regulator [Cytobacillus luteolus]